jgi:hypothetical protein
MAGWIVWKHVRIRVPAGWEVHTTPTNVRIFPESSPRDPNGEVSPLDGVYVGIVAGPPEALRERVAALMSRRVKQGQPEARQTRLAGLDADEQVWIDGVCRIESWFVTHKDTIYEVERAEPLIRVAGNEDDARMSRALVETGVAFI